MVEGSSGEKDESGTCDGRSKAEGDDGKGGAKGTASEDDVAAMIKELQRLTLTLRDKHGVACTILDKDGQVVTLEDEQGGRPEEGVESEAAAGNVARVEGCMDSLVGHEQTDVVLKINGNSGIKYLHASSGTTEL